MIRFAVLREHPLSALRVLGNLGARRHENFNILTFIQKSRLKRLLFYRVAIKRAESCLPHYT